MSLDHITLTKIFRPGTPVVINVEEYEDTDAGVLMPAFTVDATVREVTDAGVVVEYYWFSEPQVVTRTPESLTITPPPLETVVPDSEPRHGCGMCDGVLTYAGMQGTYPTWTCSYCEWWHIAKDCCDLPTEN